MATTKITTPELFDFSDLNTALQLPSGDTASRPTSPSGGEWRFNSELKYVEYYDSSTAKWYQIDTEALPLPSDFPSQNFNVSTYFGTGAAQTIDAKFNEAANFNGTDSLITLTDSLDATLGANNFSYSFWIKGPMTSTSQIWISLAQNYFVYISYQGSQVYISFYNDVFSTAVTISADTWTHIGFAKSSANGILVTKNGVSSYTSTTAQAKADLGTTGIGQGNVIGDYSGGGNDFEGSMDQVRFYNGVLSEANFNYIYTNETTTTASELNPSGFPSGCIAAYQLDGDALDVSGNYNGAVSNVGFTGLQFQPDFVWIKNRTFANSPQIIDSVRGVTKQLITSTTDPEQTYTNGLTAFTANGFTVGSLNDVNKDGDKLVAWSLKAGGSSNTFNIDDTGYATASAASLDGGTISPTGASVNTASGFSIIQYTGNDTQDATYNTGLTVTSDLVITKSTSTMSWYVWSSVLPSATNYLKLEDSGGAQTTYTPLYPTNPVSGGAGVFKIGSDQGVNESTKSYISYHFANINGYQRVGTYTGNASTYGEFVYTTSDGTASGTDGFEPAFLLVKCVSAGSTNWRLYDNKRNSQNPTNCYLQADTSDAEECQYPQFNFYSNGFQAIGTDTSINASGATMIYLAIGSNPAPTPTLANSLKTVAYTGDGVNGRSVNDVGFLPQFTWIKNLGDNLAGVSESHVWIDQLRYPTNIINSNEAIAQYNSTSSSYQSFIGNGFTLGNDGQVNSSAANYISYSWKGASIPTINNAGTITSVTSVNDDAGFSVVAYKGTGANATVGHGLQTAPQLILFKAAGAAVNWVTYNVHSTATKYMSLNLAFGDYSSAIEFQDTDPTGGASGVITLGSSGNPNNATYPMVAYCFHDISGYQKVGTYSGTGASLNQIYTTDDGTSGGANGFAPSVVIFKCTSNDGTGWRIFDTTRGTDSSLTINNSNSQYVDSAGNYVDFTSSGFEFNNTGYTQENGDLNGSGRTYIYLAIK